MTRILSPEKDLPLFALAKGYGERTAIRTGNQSLSYAGLLETSGKVAHALLNGREDLDEARIAFLAPPGLEYVCIQWGIWRAGGIAVPLCEKHPLPSMEYVIRDTAAESLVCTADFEEFLEPLGLYTHLQPYESFISEGHPGPPGKLPGLEGSRRAMILYTSGTTGLPKGVVSTHDNLEAQITALTKAWAWEKDDHILNVLPLHHVHGIVNMLCCALWSGACCEFLPRFSPDAVFDKFLQGNVNLFMAVPTIYFKLIARFRELTPERQEVLSKSMRPFRLMVSGSAALPVSVLEDWRDISGHTLLERYGMTEMGMAISNPYYGQRRPGHIGQPLPGVSVRLAGEDDQIVPEGQPGEIRVCGANVFPEYWGKPEETRKAFTADGWFKTGDIALLDAGSYRILGRNSVDIIKSGGYKISALEIEEVLRTHPQVADCGVVGLPDPEWGEVIGAGLVTEGTDPDPEALTEWLKEKLPAYKVPRRYRILEQLPRNVLGKVTKNELKTLFESKTESE